MIYAITRRRKFNCASAIEFSHTTVPMKSVDPYTVISWDDRASRQAS